MKDEILYKLTELLTHVGEKVYIFIPFRKFAFQSGSSVFEKCFIVIQSASLKRLSVVVLMRPTIKNAKNSWNLVCMNKKVGRMY